MIRWILVAIFTVVALWADTPKNGLIATFKAAAKTDHLVVPQLAISVPRGQSPTSFLPPGEYKIEFSGWVTVDLRAQYTFGAQLNGKLELQINGASALNATGTGEVVQASKPIRLNRGTNAILARFAPPPSGDAQLQMLWSSKSIPHPIPVPTEAFSYNSTSSELVAAQARRLGQHLFREFRCGNCHTSTKSHDRDAPDFATIGSRLNADWMAEYIANPKRHMPRLFNAPDNANAIATYLSTLKGDALPESAGHSPRGAALYETLRCAACHTPTDLAYVGRKFQRGALPDYLKNPQAHFRSNPMPNFKLSAEEAGDLAAYLASEQPPPTEIASNLDGRKLVQESGCLNCHNADLENKYSAPAMKNLAAGCLSFESSPRAPRFTLSPDQIRALRAFMQAREFDNIERPMPMEVALRDIERLRCASCHDAIEGAPRFSWLGGKLNPEWAARFILGEISYKPRPWLKARMPAFPNASSIAQGLAALHGVGSMPANTNINSELAAIGAKLVSVAGGFSCVACHAVGEYTSGQVVEAPGVNLAHSGERLLPSFFQRWVMNPVTIEPSTKMPVYFDAEGRSQLTDILDGDGLKQIDAMWQYIRLGHQMPAPPTP